MNWLYGWQYMTSRRAFCSYFPTRNTLNDCINSSVSAEAFAFTLDYQIEMPSGKIFTKCPFCIGLKSLLS